MLLLLESKGSATVTSVGCVRNQSSVQNVTITSTAGVRDDRMRTVVVIFQRTAVMRDVYYATAGAVTCDKCKDKRTNHACMSELVYRPGLFFHRNIWATSTIFRSCARTQTIRGNNKRIYGSNEDHTGNTSVPWIHQVPCIVQLIHSRANASPMHCRHRISNFVVSLDPSSVLPHLVW